VIPDTVLCRVVGLQFGLQTKSGMHQLMTRIGMRSGKASLMPRGWSRSTLGVLRIVIIIVAGFSIWEFSDGFLLAWEPLAEPTEARLSLRPHEDQQALRMYPHL
jgi:hypothetical protein